MDEKSTWSPTWWTMDKVSWFHGFLEFSLVPHNAKYGRPWLFLLFFLARHIAGRFHNRFQDKQTTPNNSLKLIDFETYYINPNPPLFSRQQNMQWSCNMVDSHFTLCLRARDYIKWLSQHPWYGVWMRVKGPHHHKVTALGSCVKWP